MVLFSKAMGSGKKRKRQNTTRSDDGNGNESRQRQSKKDKTTTTTTTNLHDTGNSHSSSRNQKERRQEQVDAKKHVGTKETKSKLLSSTSSSFIFNKYDYNQQSNNNNNHNISKKSFYTPQDGSEYNELIQNHYQGFVHIPAKNVTPTSFHQFARKTLEKLRDSNYYQVSCWFFFGVCVCLEGREKLRGWLGGGERECYFDYMFCSSVMSSEKKKITYLIFFSFTFFLNFFNIIIIIYIFLNGAVRIV